MEVVESVDEMQSLAIRLRGQGKLLGLVATMGALHEGHLSLIDAAREKADVTIVSIFVNPTQFGPNEDFERYPRTLEDDLAACEARGADIVFVPSLADIYPKQYSTYVNEEMVSRDLGGQSRPGHFRGVTTVVTILFNVTRPDFAVFGRKDAQQCAIIRKMVKDLRMPVEVIAVETVREAGGLAMSSRNKYLEPDQRADATRIYGALTKAREMVANGVRSVDRLMAEVSHELSRSHKIRIIYIRVVDRELLHPVREVEPGNCLMAIAVWMEETRLIDNIDL